MSYGLALPFDTDDPTFVRGVEIGRLWEILKHTPEAFEQTVHVSNAEMMLRLGEATDRTVESEELDEIWMVVKFGEVEDAG